MVTEIIENRRKQQNGHTQKWRHGTQGGALQGPLAPQRHRLVPWCPVSTLEITEMAPWCNDLPPWCPEDIFLLPRKITSSAMVVSFKAMAPNRQQSMSATKIEENQKKEREKGKPS